VARDAGKRRGCYQKFDSETVQIIRDEVNGGKRERGRLLNLGFDGLKVGWGEKGNKNGGHRKITVGGFKEEGGGNYFR